MFDKIFPPSFDPINAGFLSMAENDVFSRVCDICQEIESSWGKILPSSDIITNALADNHLEYWMLPQSARDMLDYFDIIEG